MKKNIKKVIEENKKLREEVEILSDTKLLKEINKSLEEIKKGHFITL